MAGESHIPLGFASGCPGLGRRVRRLAVRPPAGGLPDSDAGDHDKQSQCAVGYMGYNCFLNNMLWPFRSIVGPEEQTQCGRALVPQAHEQRAPNKPNFATSGACRRVAALSTARGARFL